MNFKKLSKVADELDSDFELSPKDLRYMNLDKEYSKFPANLQNAANAVVKLMLSNLDNGPVSISPQEVGLDKFTPDAIRCIKNRVSYAYNVDEYKGWGTYTFLRKASENEITVEAYTNV